MTNPIDHLGLLCIDLQTSFLKVIPQPEQLLRRCRFALEAAQLLGVSIAVTEQIPEKLGPSHPDLSAIWPETTPVFSKSNFSALAAGGLHRWLEANHIEHLLLIGIEVPICIYQTAVQALGDDLGVTVLSDCVSQRRNDDRAAVFQQLLKMEAHILPAETVFYSLLGSAEHPDFREFTRLVKAANS